jgi:hypothetical protein
MNLYQYVKSIATLLTDPTGTDSTSSSFVITPTLVIPIHSKAWWISQQIEEYAVKLLDKFGIRAHFGMAVVNEEYVEEGLVWNTTYYMKHFHTSVDGAANAGLKSLRYARDKLHLHDPILITDFIKLSAGMTLPYMGGKPEGIIINMADIDGADFALPARIIVHELLAHYLSGYKHPLPEGWEYYITRKAYGDTYTVQDEKITCTVATWISDRGGTPDDEYIDHDK